MKMEREESRTRSLPGVSSHESPATHHADIWQWRTGTGLQRRPDRLAVEEPLELRIRGESFLMTMRTPGEDRELAAGLLYTESIITEGGDLIGLEHCRRGTENAANILNVFLRADLRERLRKLERRGFISSSCGICGKSAIDSAHQQHGPAPSGPKFSMEELDQLGERLKAAQKTFATTGGLHAAALFDERLGLVALREDIGRHNAVDKVIGHALLTGQLPLARHLLLVSGRASFEIMQKALAARIPIVAAISAPSSLAVEFARESNQTLIGFLRRGSFNVYAGPERVGR